MNPTPPSRAARWLWLLLAGGALAGLGALIVAGYLQGRLREDGEAAAEQPVAAAPRILEVAGEPVIQLDPAARQASGIEVSVLSPAPWQAMRQGYGMVLDPAPLAEFNQSLAVARSQMQAAQARLAASRTASERDRALYRNQQNVSLAQVQAADATLLADQAGLDAAAAGLRTLAATAAQSFGSVLGPAILAGGATVQRLIDRRDVLVQVTLPPGVAAAAPPQAAYLRAEGMPPVALHYLSPAARMDPRLQGPSFLYVAAGNDALPPGLNVAISLPLGPAAAGTVIPAAATVWWQDMAWIYRETGPDRFARTRIATDLPAGDGGYVVNGLPPGTRIVTQGAQLLLSEEFRAQIQVDAE